MGILDSLQDMINQGSSQANSQASTQGASGSGQGFGGLGNVLSEIMNNVSASAQGSGGTGSIFGTPSSPSVLGVSAIGGLVGALLGGKGLRGVTTGALLAGGIQMFNEYKARVKRENEKNSGGPVFDVTPSSPDERAQRIIRAIVYAAKSDGHIDEEERRNIDTQLKSLHLGTEGEELVRRAMDETLDPTKIAEGVKTPDEALEIFTISSAVLNVDQFMERSYLDALAKALTIPDDVRDEIIDKIKTAQP